MTVWTPGPPYAYPVVCVVRGGSGTGRPFNALGPWTVRIDGNVIVPHSLIEAAEFAEEAQIEKAPVTIAGDERLL